MLQDYRPEFMAVATHVIKGPLGIPLQELEFFPDFGILDLT